MWIPLAEAKQFLRVSHDEDDDLITRIVGAARRHIERDIARPVAELAEDGVLPDDLVFAGLHLVGHWYENRQAVITGPIATEVALGVDVLLQPFRTETIPYE